jgi:hypothetical protein
MRVKPSFTFWGLLAVLLVILCLLGVFRARKLAEVETSWSSVPETAPEGIEKTDESIETAPPLNSAPGSSELGSSEANTSGNLQIAHVEKSYQTLDSTNAEKTNVGSQHVGSSDTKSLPQSWTNTLEMRFVFVPGASILFSIWDTRVKDYVTFISETHRMWERPRFTENAFHPAVNVSWEDAKAFCEWLTEKERSAGALPEGLSYRLPTVDEWGIAAGISSDDGGAFQQTNRVFFWGQQWPPPWASGNFSQKLHADGYSFTSPVGVFAPNAMGLFDVCGNVYQWCEPPPGRLDRPFRGASWDDYDLDLVGCRKIIFSVANNRSEHIGFRIVLY